MDILGGQNNRSSFTLTSLNDYHRRFDPVITRTLSLTNDLSTLDVMAKTFIEVSTPFLEEIPPKLIERLTKSDFSQIHEIAEQWLEISDERTYQAQTDQEPNDVIIHLGKKIGTCRSRLLHRPNQCEQRKSVLLPDKSELSGRRSAKNHVQADSMSPNGAYGL